MEIILHDPVLIFLFKAFMAILSLSTLLLLVQFFIGIYKGDLNAFYYLRLAVGLVLGGCIMLLIIPLLTGQIPLSDSFSVPSFMDFKYLLFYIIIPFFVGMAIRMYFYFQN